MTQFPKSVSVGRGQSVPVSSRNDNNCYQLNYFWHKLAIWNVFNWPMSISNRSKMDWEPNQCSRTSFHWHSVCFDFGISVARSPHWSWLSERKKLYEEMAHAFEIGKYYCQYVICSFHMFLTRWRPIFTGKPSYKNASIEIYYLNFSIFKRKTNFGIFIMNNFSIVWAVWRRLNTINASNLNR